MIRKPIVDTHTTVRLRWRRCRRHDRRPRRPCAAACGHEDAVTIRRFRGHICGQRHVVHAYIGVLLFRQLVVSYTAPSLAVSDRHTSVVDLLPAAGASGDDMDGGGQSPLSLGSEPNLACLVGPSVAGAAGGIPPVDASTRQSTAADDRRGHRDRAAFRRRRLRWPPPRATAQRSVGWHDAVPWLPL